VSDVSRQRKNSSLAIRLSLNVGAISGNKGDIVSSLAEANTLYFCLVFESLFILVLFLHCIVLIVALCRSRTKDSCLFNETYRSDSYKSL
jgi:hypothetical protein